jgi:hypothetical protein
MDLPLIHSGPINALADDAKPGFVAGQGGEDKKWQQPAHGDS